MTAVAATAADSKRVTIVEALRDAIRAQMRADDRVFVIGEDIRIGGAFLVTRGLVDEFGPDRIIDTPISEAGFFGLAIGAAIRGLRPIVDFQYGDFLFSAADQLVQQATKLRYMSGNALEVPLLIQLPTGASGRGAQHANSVEGAFFGTPRLKILTPATPRDTAGLLRTAFREPGVVLVCIHKHLYGSRGRPLHHQETSTGTVGEGEPAIPFGVADVKRAGRDITIVANLLMLHRALDAAARLAAEGIEADVIDPRTIVPLDVETVAASAAMTGRLLVVEESPRRAGWGAHLIAEVVSRGTPSLSRVRRLAAADVPVPYAPVLESAVIPSVTDILRAAREMVS